MIIIPAIDLRGGSCVRLTQGRKEATTIYDNDPVAVAQGFQKAGARMLHIVDLDGAFSESNSLNRAALASIVGAVEMPIQFGGGLRSIADVAGVFELGVKRTVIGTLAAESPETLKTLVQMFGSDRIVVGIDARAGKALTRGWEQNARVTALDFAHQVASIGVERIVYTDVSRDGMLTGVNVEETCRIARESGLKVTASGGVSSLPDLVRLKEAAACGIDSVIVGKALYEGRFTLEEALAALN